MTITRAVEPTPFQARVLAFRGRCGIVSGGGRGGGKSFGMALDILDHCQDGDARPLVLRESVGGLQELGDLLHTLAVGVFGRGVTRNRQDNRIDIGNGAQITLSQADDPNSTGKLRGRSFTGLYADELGNFSATGYALFRQMMSGLRAPAGKEIRTHVTANPGGRAHARVHRDFIRGREPWKPWQDEHGLWWVYCPSTLDDNPMIDQTAYRKRLLASVAGDANMASAWMAGDWSVLGGQMFAPPLDERVHIAEPPPIRLPSANVAGRYRFAIGADWGTASPSAAVLVGVLREPVANHRPGDVFVFGECDTCISDDDLSTGSGMSIAAWCDEIKGLKAQHGVDCMAVQDDARGLGSEVLTQEMQKHGISCMRPPRKDRAGTWSILRNLLQGAVDRDREPGLWFSPRCRRTWLSVSEAPRSPLNPRDVDHRYTSDHHLDALGYALQWLVGNSVIRTGTTVGLY